MQVDVIVSQNILLNNILLDKKLLLRKITYDDYKAISDITVICYSLHFQYSSGTHVY